SARRVGRLSPALALVPAAIWSAYPIVAYHVTTGMETMLAAALLLAVSLLGMRWLQEPSRWQWSAALGGAIFVAAATRPEAVLYGGIVVALVCAMERRRIDVRRCLLALAVTLL